MNEVRTIVTGPEEAYDNEAELWCDHQLMGITLLHEGRLHLRVDPRPDGSPWLMDIETLRRSLAEAEQRLSAYRRSQPSRRRTSDFHGRDGGVVGAARGGR